MKDEVLSRDGVRVKSVGGGVRYTLPWRRHTAMRGSGWRAFFGAVLPCVAALLLPNVMMHFLLGGAPAWGAIAIWIWSVIWWVIGGFFICLFGAMTASMATKWGRAWLWVNESRIFSLQLMGEEGRAAYLRLAGITEISTQYDRGAAGNPAASGRLLASTGNDVTRLVADYPVELLEALREDLEGRVRGARRRR